MSRHILGMLWWVVFIEISMILFNSAVKSKLLGSCLYSIRMENKAVSKWLMILLMVAMVTGQSYFSGLNIDPILLRDTEAAINDLKYALQQNLNCRPPPLSAFLGSILKTAFFPFKSIKGLSGYNAVQPTVTCMFNIGRVFYSIYQKVVKVIDLLQKVRSQLIQYNNIIIGSGNTVIGSNNMVIGSKDSFQGNNNWVFTSDYHSTDPLNGVLILGVYLIELEDILQITYNPTGVIRCIEQAESNKQFNSFWGQATPSFRFSF